MPPSADPLALSTRFLRTYNTLVDFLCASEKASGFQTEQPWLSHNNLINRSRSLSAKQKNDLSRYAKLPNAIVHMNNPGEYVAIAEPHLDVVEHYERLVNSIIQPPTAMSSAVQANKIFHVTPADSAFESIKYMNEMVYTHAPVLIDGRVSGVFSENTVFSYLGHHAEAILDAHVQISEFHDFLPVESHASEHFSFVSRNTSLAEVGEIFKQGLVDRRRIGAVFVTQTGESSQRLLAMLTAWDLAGSDFLDIA